MGWLGNLRAAGAMSAAAALVEKRLQLEVQVGRLRAVDAKPLAHGLVTELFRSSPELLESPAKISPLLLAGAALAKGVKDADALGKAQMSGMLLNALRTVWSLDLLPLDVERMTPPESRLMELAYSAFEPSTQKMASRPDHQPGLVPGAPESASADGASRVRPRVNLDPPQRRSPDSSIRDIGAIRPGRE